MIRLCRAPALRRVVDRQLTAPIDPLWLQDAGSTLVDPVGLVMDWLAAHHADTLELAMLHGGTDGDLAGSDSPAAGGRGSGRPL